MARTYAFRTLDVFTDTAYAGNPLAVVRIPAPEELHPPHPLTQADKQKIATEFNLSETIFVHEPLVWGVVPEVTVDIFTTESELPFAGHPTVGAIFFVLTELFIQLSQITIKLKAGPVAGSFDKSTGLVRAQMPLHYHLHTATIDYTTRVAIDGVQPSLKSAKMRRTKHPLVSVAPGVDFVLVDLTPSPDLLTQVRVSNLDPGRPEDLDPGSTQNLIGTLYFARQEDGEDGTVRIDQRVVVMGLEDPATGAGSCALTAYLALQAGGARKTHRFELTQGEQMGRKSVIGVEVTLDSKGTAVKTLVLSGRCKAVMKGELEV